MAPPTAALRWACVAACVLLGIVLSVVAVVFGVPPLAAYDAECLSLTACAAAHDDARACTALRGCSFAVATRQCIGTPTACHALLTEDACVATNTTLGGCEWVQPAVWPYLAYAAFAAYIVLLLVGALAFVCCELGAADDEDIVAINFDSASDDDDVVAERDAAAASGSRSRGSRVKRNASSKTGARMSAGYVNRTLSASQLLAKAKTLRISVPFMGRTKNVLWTDETSVSLVLGALRPWLQMHAPESNLDDLALFYNGVQLSDTAALLPAYGIVDGAELLLLELRPGGAVGGGRRSGGSWAVLPGMRRRPTAGGTKRSVMTLPDEDGDDGDGFRMRARGSAGGAAAGDGSESLQARRGGGGGGGGGHAVAKRVPSTVDEDGEYEYEYEEEEEEEEAANVPKLVKVKVPLLRKRKDVLWEDDTTVQLVLDSLQPWLEKKAPSAKGKTFGLFKDAEYLSDTSQLVKNYGVRDGDELLLREVLAQHVSARVTGPAPRRGNSRIRKKVSSVSNVLVDEQQAPPLTKKHSSSHRSRRRSSGGVGAETQRVIDSPLPPRPTRRASSRRRKGSEEVMQQVEAVDSDDDDDDGGGGGGGVHQKMLRVKIPVLRKRKEVVWTDDTSVELVIESLRPWLAAKLPEAADDDFALYFNGAPLRRSRLLVECGVRDNDEVLMK